MTFLPALPRDASLHGHHVDGILRYLTVTTGVCFGVLLAILLVAVLFHRGRRPAHYTHGDRPRDRLPALIALTRIFGPRLIASAWVSASTPPLVAA